MNSVHGNVFIQLQIQVWLMCILQKQKMQSSMYQVRETIITIAVISHLTRPKQPYPRYYVKPYCNFTA